VHKQREPPSGHPQYLHVACIKQRQELRYCIHVNLRGVEPSLIMRLFVADRLCDEQHDFYEVWGTVCVRKGQDRQKLFLCKRCVSKVPRKDCSYKSQKGRVYTGLGCNHRG